MLVAELVFNLSKPSTAEAIDAVNSVFAAWHHNGQIEVEWQLVELPDQIFAYALLPEPESLEPRYDNRYVTQSLEGLARHGVHAPVVVVRGTSPDFERACSCATRPSLILFTTMFSKCSPIRCGACFMPVSLFRLPYTHDFEHFNVLSWAADYRACDTLQMHCTTGERFGESQLLKHDGSLSREGREIARRLAVAAGIPVYYYLFKARGRSNADELRRTCPECGGSWFQSTPWHELFDFRCDQCGLLSNIACSLAR